MHWKRSREHILRRIERYYLLAAAAKAPKMRRTYIELARLYRLLLKTASA